MCLSKLFQQHIQHVKRASELHKHYTGYGPDISSTAMVHNSFARPTASPQHNTASSALDTWVDDGPAGFEYLVQTDVCVACRSHMEHLLPSRSCIGLCHPALHRARHHYPCRVFALCHKWPMCATLAMEHGVRCSDE